ncbi:MAG: hypothetical protein CML68_17190 [Rhodobacteraceae bacterium]|nr:hypothetical protein [Paracoccaceae bacterium]
MSDATVKRIDALTANARSTWLGLFSVLVFAVVTLVSVEHIDFYGVGRGTQLPVVNITVPTYLFFYAAPILVFATYGYLHLYLIRLWDALSEAPPRINRTRLGEAVSPWLMTDAALSLREILRQDGCAQRRETDYTSMALNFAITWLATPFVMGWIWCKSMPARDFWMTSVGALMFAGALAMGSVSLRLLLSRMRHTKRRPTNYLKVTAAYTISVTLLCAAALAVTWGRTVETIGPVTLAAIDLHDQRLTERPSGWLPYAIAYKEDMATWCRREGVDDCGELTPEQRQEHLDEWRIKRTARILDLSIPAHLNRFRMEATTEVAQKPITNTLGLNGGTFAKADNFEHDASTPYIFGAQFDLTGADLRGAFLVNLNLSTAKMANVTATDADLEGASMPIESLDGANFKRANLSRSDFRNAKIREVDFSSASLQDANFSESFVQGTSFDGANMNGADLRETTMQKPSFSFAKMQNTDLSNSDLIEANFRLAELQNSDFRNSTLKKANFISANLQQANLQGAELDSAKFQKANMTGARLQLAEMQNAELHRTHLRTANLTDALLEHANMSYAEMQGAILIRAKMKKAVLLGANLEGADLNAAQLQDAELEWAKLQDANLSGARLPGAVLSMSLLTDNARRGIISSRTVFYDTINHGGALKSVDLSSAKFDNTADWRNVFFDGSVTLSPFQRLRIGNACQMADTILSDEDFFSRWREWFEQRPDNIYPRLQWRQIAPAPWQEIPAADALPEGCTWHTGPLPPEHGGSR